MPKSPVPIFRAAKASWQIDTCKPQMEAIAQKKIVFHGLSHGGYPGVALKQNELPGLPSLGHWTVPKAQDWGLEYHRNEGVEICWLESGSCAFEVDGSRHLLHPDALTVTGPWQLHRLGDPHIGAGRLHWLILDVGVRRPNQEWQWPKWLVLTPEDQKELADRLLGEYSPVLRATPDLRDNFRRLAQAVEKPRDPGQLSRIAVQVNDLLWNLLTLLRSKSAPSTRSNAPDSNPNERTVRLFWEDLERHPEHLAEARSVRGMAAECGVGVTAFTALTKSLFDATPMNLLLARRLEHAGQLLKTTDRAVTDIALACGFSSSQYFATCFGKRFGMTPKAWRAMGN